jgi:hypothetical protein
MARIHLFEFEDLQWFPGFLRNYMTDFLQFLSNKTKMLGPAIPLLEKGIEQSRDHTLVDLASGGGGGMIWLNSELLKKFSDLKIILTDLYPNKDAFEYTKKQSSSFKSVNTPVDARNVPENIKGLRTLLLSFHHFKPDDAVRILQDAVDSQNNIAVFEGQERSLTSIFAMLFSPITVLLTTPLIRPFKIGRIIFTYLIPLVPLFAWWDGIVSSLRTYSVKEMNELVLKVKGHKKYNWDIGKMNSGPGVILYLTGTKK